MKQRTRGVFFPVILIAIGIIFLLVNTDVLSPAAVQRLGDLWPLILVILGIQLVLNHTLPRGQARIAGLAGAAIIVLAALGYAILAPASQVGTQHQESSEALNGLTAATLDLGYGGASVDVQSAALGTELFQATVDYPNGEQPPDVTVDREAGTLQISGGNSSGFHLFGGPRTRHISVTLTNRIPWSVQIAGGAADLHLQLENLQLSKLEISGGVSRMEVTLPRPKGTLAVDVAGGASTVSLHAPANTEWRVAVSGGVSSLNINGRAFGGIGAVHQQSHGYDRASDRLNIDVSGGVSQVDFRTG
jgi:Domain of unknown function (DUF5668)